MIDRISSTALSGLRKGLADFESVAERISKTAASNLYNPSATTKPILASPSEVSEVPGEIQTSLEKEMVDLLLARRFIQGQIGIIQTEDEILAELVNLGRRRSPA